MRVRTLVPVALLAACALGVGGMVPSRVRPGADPAVDEQIAAARTLFERGHPRAALNAAEAILAGNPDAVDAHRLRQDLLRNRGRLAHLRSEALAGVAVRERDAHAHYLLGRTLPAGSERQRETFARAAGLEPDSMWPWLGYAYALREAAPAESAAIYEQLYAASHRHPAVAVAHAHALRGNGRLREAVAVYEQMSEDGTGRGVGHLGLAQTLFAMGGRDDRLRGFGELLMAVRERPFDPGVHGVVRELLRLGIADEQVEQLLDVLREDADRFADFARGGGASVLVDLLLRLQQPHAALAVLAADAGPEQRAARRRHLRRLRLMTGDVEGFLDQLDDDLPRHLLEEEANVVRGRWLALLDGPWREGAPLGSVALAVGLARALRDVGLLIEAEALAGLGAVRFGEVADLEAVRDEVRRELAFENELRRLLYQGYDAEASAEFGLDELFARLRAVSLRVFGSDVVGTDARFSVPLVGELLDPFAAGLCQHLARYNRHLVLGQRAGGVPEGLLFTRLSVSDLAASDDLPLPGRCREVIGFDRDVRSLTGVLGGDLAGVALLSHYVIDFDAVVEWAAGLLARRRVVREDDGAALRDGLPAGEDPLAPLDVGWRLAAVSPLEDSELVAAVLETIRLHERRHLVDAFHYLPIEANLWRGLGLLLRFGLSSAAIEAEMERRAELAALALGGHPELVLAHVADFMGERDPASPHVRGFGHLGRQMVAALQAQGVPPAAAAVANWHRLEPAAVRAAAATLLAELP